MQDNNTQSVIEFGSGSSIKSVTIQTNPNMKITTQFMRVKMLLAKTSIFSFVYDMIDVFYFPEDNPKVQPIFDKHKIEKRFLYQNVTGTNSTHLFLVFIWNLNCQLNEKDSKNVIFEVMINSKIFERLDLSNEFWSQFNKRDTLTEKQVGLHDVEGIDHPNIVTMTVNLKEFIEKYKDNSLNKNHQGLKKETSGMHSEAYTNRVMTLNGFANQKVKKIQQNRFQIKNMEMRMQSISKSQFAGLNNKRFYFQYSIVSMPFGHPLLENLRKEKRNTYSFAHKGK